MHMDFNQGFRLDGQTAMVTGAATGIGFAVAELFAAQGARVVLLDRSPDVVAAAARLPGRHLGLVCDVARQSDIDQAVVQTIEQCSAIDILVNNAGVALLDMAFDVREADWDTTLAINLKAAFFLSRAVAHGMRERGRGRIVNLASQASVIALERHVAYCASKAALVSMTQVLAVEWAPYGITVNAVSPTVVETALGKKAWAGEVGESMKKKIPVGRFAQPEEVAAAILYLVSGHSRIVTGANLLIDGGYTVQ
jgi:NAD(P)-dependent dehydrogenase (short-subunit alcohol dehydrogenase family)